MIGFIRSQKSLLIFFNIISCVMLFIFAMIIFQQAKKSENYDAWVLQSYEILSIANRIDNNAYHIESAYRGYLLTGAKELLDPVTDINQTIFMDFNNLENLVSDSFDQEKSLASVRDIYGNFATLQDELRQVYQQHGAPSLSISDILASQKMMNQLQDELRKFMLVELQNLNQRIALEQDENARHTTTIFMCAVISILVLVIANALILILMSSASKTKILLHDVEELYKLALENMSDGLFDYNAKTEKVAYSSSYKRQLGYKDDELPNDIHKGFHDLIHPDDHDRVWNEAMDYINKKAPSYSTAFRMKRKDSSWIWVLSRAMATWDEGGEFIRIVGVHTNITEQKQREEELRELNSEMENFTYIASHDLRSPLVNIKGFTKEVGTSVEKIRDLYTENPSAFSEQEFRHIVEKDIPESLNFISSAVERMDTLTNAILNLSRIGRRVYKPTRINVNDIVTRCLNTMNYELNAAHAKSHVGDLPEITADAMAMEQIFSNLIDNAVKYLDPKRAGEITIAGVRQDQNITYAIKDNGRGINQKEGEKIFSIFRRANNSTNVRGSGMGLAFIRATIRKMGGNIRYESVPDQGTTFYVTLPDNQHGETNNAAA